VIVDPRKEKNAIKEAQKLGVATVALIDTDCDPDMVDLPIPGNDDGIRSVELIVRLLADAVVEGNGRAAQQQMTAAQSDEKGDAAADEPAAATVS
jgi:small subunit ribosomal protein S2